MTKLTYMICKNDRPIKRVNTYNEAVKAVEELGKGWTYKAEYTYFDPTITEEYLASCRAHAHKMRAHFLKKHAST